MSALTLPACLITQPVQFEQPPTFPPSIESSPTAENPLDDVIRIRLDEVPPPSIALDVIVRDPDADEELVYLLYVDYVPTAPRLADETRAVPIVDPGAGMDRTRRAVTIGDTISARLMTVGCHRIELFVSSDFRGQTREPVIEGNVGTAVWWVATRAVEGDTTQMESCP